MFCLILAHATPKSFPAHTPYTPHTPPPPPPPPPPAPYRYYFKAKVASAIGELTEKSDPMNAVKEELLREIAQRDALDAQESEQFRRTLEAFKHEVCGGEVGGGSGVWW